MAVSTSATGHIGKYRLLSGIGNGGFGVVHLAEDLVLGRNVAVKVLPAHLVSDAKSLKRFRGEAKLVAKLQHPNIVRIHSFEVVDGVPLIEMEYIEGGSLADRLQREVVTPTEVVRWARDVAFALEHCHALGMIHRDVKPSNILINRFGRAQLADFGISSLLAASEESGIDASQTQSFRGTPHYAAPEAWDGGTPTPAWDVYSLGAVMYEALTGAPPHGDVGQLALARKIATERVPLIHKVNAAISPEASALVAEMLEPRPENRPASARELIQRLESLPEYVAEPGQPDSTRTIPMMRRDRARDRTRRLRAIIGATVFALFVAIIGIVALVQWNGANGNPIAGLGARPLERASTESIPADLREWELDAFLSSRRTPRAEAVVMAAQLGNGNPSSDERWLVELADGVPIRVSALGATTISVFQLTPAGQSGEFSVAGDWAGYADAHGTVFRHGTVRGSLRWRGDPAVAAGILERLSDVDGSAAALQVLADETADKTDVEFLYRLEESDVHLPVLWNELVPRRMPWAEHLVDWLPAFPAGRLVAGAGEEAAGEYTIDGLPNEAFWIRGAGVGGLPGFPPGNDSAIALHVANSEVLLSARVRTDAESGALGLHAAIMPGYSMPNQASLTILLSYDGRDTRVTVPRGIGTATPHSSCASAFGNGYWTVECGIAFAREPSAAGTAEEWRLNASIRNLESGDTLVWWGYPDEDEVHHGAVVRITASEPETLE